MNRIYSVLWLAALALLNGDSFAQPQEAPPAFRVSAFPRTTKSRLLVRLSVTNVSRQNQLFWAAKDYCTNQHWKTDDPSIRLWDGSREATKTCGWTCIHRITLHPGEAYTVTLPLDITQSARTGQRVLKFANVQPPLELIRLIGQNRAPANRRYEPQVFWSEPVIMSIGRQFVSPLALPSHR